MPLEDIKRRVLKQPKKFSFLSSQATKQRASAILISCFQCGNDWCASGCVPECRWDMDSKAVIVVLSWEHVTGFHGKIVFENWQFCETPC